MATIAWFVRDCDPKVAIPVPALSRVNLLPVVCRAPLRLPCKQPRCWRGEEEKPAGEPPDSLSAAPALAYREISASRDRDEAGGKVEELLCGEPGQGLEGTQTRCVVCLLMVVCG